MKSLAQARPVLLAVLTAAALVAGCATPPAPPSAVAPVTPPVTATAPAIPAPQPVDISDAVTQQGYRFDAASHLYVRNSERIYKGVMPHYLYAIGVLQIQVDARGQLVEMSWMRAPEHAPEVIAEIERTVRQAAPFPAPVQMGSATYVETWLWDVSGRFQLRTLTEGQSGLATAASRLLNAPVLRVVAAP